MSTGKCLSLSSSCPSLIDSGNLCDRDDHLNCAHFILWTSQVSLFSTYSAGDTVAKFICGCFPLNLYFLWSHPFLSLPRGCILSRNVNRKCLSRKKLKPLLALSIFVGHSRTHCFNLQIVLCCCCFLKLLFTEMLQLFFDGGVVMHVILNATCNLLNLVSNTRPAGLNRLCKDSNSAFLTT